MQKYHFSWPNIKAYVPNVDVPATFRTDPYPTSKMYSSPSLASKVRLASYQTLVHSIGSEQEEFQSPISVVATSVYGVSVVALKRPVEGAVQRNQTSAAPVHPLTVDCVKPAVVPSQISYVSRLMGNPQVSPT